MYGRCSRFGKYVSKDRFYTYSGQNEQKMCKTAVSVHILAGIPGQAGKDKGKTGNDRMQTPEKSLSLSDKST